MHEILAETVEVGDVIIGADGVPFTCGSWVYWHGATAPLGYGRNRHVPSLPYETVYVYDDEGAVRLRVKKGTLVKVLSRV